jgi:arylsulfatase A-like enzyme
MADPRPNIVLILTDDLDARSVTTMANVERLLTRQGTTFANFFAATPLCCPSRATILRGQYPHNHRVLGNTADVGGFTTFFELGRESSTVATWLRGAGYRTGFVGKYLNGYPRGASPTHVPPGWDEWQAAVDEREAYDNLDYDLNDNGRIVHFGRRRQDYFTDVVARKAVAFIEGAVSAGEPCFAYVAPVAPHSPATPARRHRNQFADAGAPRPPSFDEEDVADKPRWVRRTPPLSPAKIERIDERYRQRLRSLLAVDELVAAVVAALDAGGRESYLFFASDNGFHLGEHRQPHGKQSPYEEAIRVPLIVRGPGVPRRRVVRQLAVNTDLAPTFAELAGAAAAGFVDGRSLAPLLRPGRPPVWRRRVLLELLAPQGAQGQEDRPAVAGSGPSVPRFRALRTVDRSYVEYGSGERELYDLADDQFQLENIVERVDRDAVCALSDRLATLADCDAGGCRLAEDAR